MILDSKRSQDQGGEKTELVMLTFLQFCQPLATTFVASDSSEWVDQGLADLQCMNNKTGRGLRVVIEFRIV